MSSVFPKVLLLSIERETVSVLDGIFRVSADGRVYRPADKKLKYYVLASQSRSGDGKYMVVSATVDNKQKHFYVHRLIAEAYIPNPENKREINHIDGNGINNSVDNLEWCTRSENTIHAYSVGLIPSTATRGAPCVMCGELTLQKDKVCTGCKMKIRIKEAMIQKREARATKMLSIFDFVSPDTFSDRELAVLELRASGHTLNEIGNAFGISRERVRQVLNSVKERANRIIT